ncbi:CLUMA_CG017368, isoform A [Clunio marinus]|uniref:CLUMA_CG017368, isoform A n=1 Tax=Clunio marinus TaxID=568069 RepID=A0A1J1IYN8_9DIPT|nr:CLUMA_CG017368, isoform A [Clunio marinus]
MSCNSTSDHSFFGYWEIIESLDSSLSENLGLNGIKFLLDESGDIIWFNDLFSIQVVSVNDDQQSSPTIWLSKSMADDEKSKYSTGNESADIFFSCETFEVINIDGDQISNGPGLLFRSFTGHHIEFRTGSLNPMEHMTLNCDGWCTLTCKRIKKDQSIGQSIQYTLLSAFDEKFFSDITIKSCDGFSFEVHSPILRLNGFDCSSLNQSPMSSTTIATAQPTQPLSNFLSPPTIHLSTFNFSPNFVNHISNSFNCLTTSRESIYHLTAPLSNSKNGQISSSDSHLNNLQDNSKENVFNFPTIQTTPTQTQQQQQQQQHQQSISKKNETKHKLRLSSSQIIFRNPLSPFRVRSSPLPFLNLSLDTPSSPLTSVSVLFNLTKDALLPVLHWLYSESLPQHLNESQLEDLLKICATIPPLNKIIGPCKKYLRLIKLKKVIIDIFMEIHDCLNRMINMSNPYNVARCPTSLCEIFKYCLCEISLGFTLFLQLSQIFSKDTFLNRFQRNEIIKFIKSRVPIFISQLHQLSTNVLMIMKSLQQEEKDDLVIYLVPEIILALDVTTELLGNLRKSLEAICKNIKGEHEIGEGKIVDKSAVDKDLKFFLHVCEVKKLHDIYGKVDSILEIIQHKQLTFKSMNLAEKQSCISINMDHVLIEIPIIIERLEDLSKNMDDKFGWKEFKFCFKFATSQINGILSKLLEHKATMVYSILELCQLVNKSAFTNKLVQLGLLERHVAAKHFDGSDNDNLDSEQKLIKDYNSYKINLFSGLCESPNAINSNLSKNALKLLHSGHLSDMEFEVITTSTVSDNSVSLTSTPVAIIAPSGHDNYDYNDGTAKKEYHIFKAHRVIVAARCEYLRKALLSGMQEDINRKITIYDTSPVIFRRFLLYLYGAPVDKNVGLESICELMLLADRYSVDSLKEVCEQTLMSMIDSESVICMLGISDRFNANTLKASCLSFLSQHIELTASEIFRELSQDLQAEVFELIQWRKRCTTDTWSHLSSRYDDPLRSRHSLKSPSRPSKSRSRKSSPSYHHK